MNRRNMLQTMAGVVATSSAQAAAASESSGGAAAALFDHLPGQTPINIRADAYFETALRLSRLAAMTTRCVLDIPYGPLPANRLDIYMPQDSHLTELPVFTNIHGGAWSHGYKEMMGLNAPAIVEFPAVYVSVEYRLAPAAKYPAPVLDCALALGWVFRNIARFGGDPGRIHIGGHSAGAQIASLITLRRGFRDKHALPTDVVKSCFPYCGIYDLRAMHIYGQPEVDPVRTARSWTGPRMRRTPRQPCGRKTTRRRSSSSGRKTIRRSSAPRRRPSSPRYSRGRAGSMG